MCCLVVVVQCVVQTSDFLKTCCWTAFHSFKHVTNKYWSRRITLLCLLLIQQLSHLKDSSPETVIILGFISGFISREKSITWLHFPAWILHHLTLSWRITRLLDPRMTLLITWTVTQGKDQSLSWMSSSFLSRETHYMMIMTCYYISSYSLTCLPYMVCKFMCIFFSFCDKWCWCRLH